ncbi:MAG: hypothetical protein F4039_06780 [Gammaproteobacteria bacterium]|nr:hypothetical protein [Gammaproteobacteria bacterium]MYF53210.1 hypothetical protein [Gammaproteobacteria bacterium]MYK43773.1 hypothetical protein [Gammaproteobacteria bacterium]
MAFGKKLQQTIAAILAPTLMLIACLCVVLVLVLVVWLTVLFIKPVATSHKPYFDKPSYAEVRPDWYLYGESESSTSYEFENRDLQAAFVTLDQLYGLVGRDEQPFSEKPEATALAAELSQGFPSAVNREQLMNEFFNDLRQFSVELSLDDGLKRIADESERTSRILLALRSYHVEYVDRLTAAMSIANVNTNVQESTRRGKIQLHLQIAAAIALTLLASSIAMLIFRIRSDLNAFRVRVEKQEQLDETS